MSALPEEQPPEIYLSTQVTRRLEQPPTLSPATLSAASLPTAPRGLGHRIGATAGIATESRLKWKLQRKDRGIQLIQKTLLKKLE
jgi:hypothetical protein